jgi:hypothetical protein
VDASKKISSLNPFPWKALLAILIGAFWVHFHDFNAFHREPIKFDDRVWVEPLFHLSLKEYFTTWLPNPTRMAFPVRDLIYMAESGLNQWLPFKTYWLTNFFIFALWISLIARTLFLVMPSSPLVISLTAFFAFHPVNLDLVQWLSLRKHSMAFLFAMAVGYMALRIQSEKRDPEKREWVWMILFCFFSLGSWGTAILLPLWLLFTFRRAIGRDWQTGLLSVILVFVGTGFYVRLFSPPGSPYAKIIESISSGDMLGLWSLTKAGFLGIGRGIFDFLIPLRISLYGDLTSPLNLIGLVFFFLIIFGTAITIKKIRSKHLPMPNAMTQSLASLGLVLLLPNLANAFISPDMFWNSRYFCAGAPLLFSSLVFYFLTSHKKWWPLTAFQWRVVATATATVCLFAVSVSLPRVRAWSSSRATFEKCYSEEKSPRCLSYLIEQTIDEQGCAMAYGYFQDSQKMIRERPEIRNSELPYTYSFFEAFCNATIVNLGTQEKRSLIQTTKDIVPSPFITLFSETLMDLEDSGPEKALDQLTHRYFESRESMKTPLVGIIANSLQGQLRYLCEVTKRPLCEDYLQEAARRSDRFGSNPVHQNWAYQTTFRHPHGQIRVPAAQKPPRSHK